MADINCSEYNLEKKSGASRRSSRAVIFSCRYSINSASISFILVLLDTHLSKLVGQPKGYVVGGFRLLGISTCDFFESIATHT